jgi:succinyl-CoA synthetase beta subunit
MKIHEYQAKALLADYGIPVERGVVIRSMGEWDGALKRLGEDLPGYVVKAQIHGGGRGIGHFADGLRGGVQVVPGKDAAREWTARMLGNRLITGQTGPKGKPVSAVYVGEKVEAKKEFYVSISVDRTRARPVILASSQGGVAIEQLVEECPEKILRREIHPLWGWDRFRSHELAFALGLGKDGMRDQFARLLDGMVRIFWEKDASLVEINPLVWTKTDGLCAVDAKINFDANGLFRQEGVCRLRDWDQEDPREVRAFRWGLSYIALDGTVACLTNGAGLAMATMDLLVDWGVRPANFLDLGDNSEAEAVAEAFRLLLDGEGTQCILVNVFGGAMQGDVVARGMVEALAGKALPVPLVVRLEGARAEEGKKLLEEKVPGTIFAADLAEMGERVRLACAN